MAHPPYDPYYMPSLHHHHHSPATPPHNHPYHHLHQHQDIGINTLFVSGLPDDVKPREIHNLFRRKPGFDSCQLKYTGRGNQVVAFATFFNHQSAIAAMHELNGVKFDPQNGSVLHIELARSNSRKKRKPGGGAYVVIDKRTRVAANAQETLSADGDSDTDEASPRDNTSSGNRDNSGNETSETTAVPDKATSINSEKTVEGVVQTCSTLFIANLGPNCTEDELKQALSLYPGFSLLKMRAKGGMPVAFADFEEIEQASKAMEELQGTMLPSSDRGGMHIEYARSKMRRF
ncbi:U2 small nuclear ribonucleoprotein B''-like [Mangifera indica]|uniref:U2 small nuclear ribonucleoprotein B''-like n=1 Tax=Mangifera indica TaxID=29780 RepID=UPI001CF9DF49|nr:U2 small nuclear ribonucleoprotein B''-like [Mangifera indica]XP_044496690.1 U2 small nuclear ribonucleoprotein B''-like [Mangifera indica]